jgi:hypothetical protein
MADHKIQELNALDGLLAAINSVEVRANKKSFVNKAILLHFVLVNGLLLIVHMHIGWSNLTLQIYNFRLERG